MNGMQSASEFQSMVMRKLAGKLRVLITGLVEQDRSQETINSLSEQVRMDYAGRMLTEFLQNANDCMRRPGKVRVILDPTQSPPLLYVANDGWPFQEQDFHDFCDLALSSKDVNESIGNKGLGFRSVFACTSSPRIYSGFDEAGTGDGVAFMLSSSTEALVQTLLNEIHDGRLPAQDGACRWNGLDIPLFPVDDHRWAAAAERLREQPRLLSTLPCQTPVQT